MRPVLLPPAIGEGILLVELLRRGDAVLIPYAAGEGEVRGDVTAIRCRPPDPGAPEGRW
jgi:hypothetical protein